MEGKIRTNGHLRPIEYGIPEWRLDDIGDNGEDEAFVRYQGQEYYLSECLSLPAGEVKDLGWQGYWGETFFSSVLVKIVEGGDLDNDYVIIGLWIV